MIYCDPPYEPMPGKDGFVSYAAGGFTWDDQKDLADELVYAHMRGAKVMVSNSGAQRVRDMYESYGFYVHDMKARRSISSKGNTRKTANDILGFCCE